MSERQPTIAVLYPGELGASFAALLRGRGARVATTLEGRGERTADRCRAAEMVVLESLAAVVRESEAVFALVSPSAAEEMASRYCDLAATAPPGAVYVDVNSIGPELAKSLAAKFDAAGVSFVDAAVNGLAKNLATTATLFLSGVRSGEVAKLIGDGMRVRTLGDEPGRASAMKMLLAGLSKGLCALYLELGLVARNYGMLSEMTEACAMIYPGVSALADRMLPTYAEHAARRATEMGELESTSRAAGIEPCVIDAVRCLHDFLAAENFGGARYPTAAALIERLAQDGFLTREP